MGIIIEVSTLDDYLEFFKLLKYYKVECIKKVEMILKV